MPSTTQTRIVVLGVGNILLTDEGVGVRAIEALGRQYDLPPEVTLLDGGTSAMEMLDDLAHADLLIIADCVRAGLPPGSLIRLADDEVPALMKLKMSPHQIGLSDVLATLVLAGESPKRIVVHGVEPASLATDMRLTPTVEQSLPRLVEALAQELRMAGVALVPRLPAEAAV
ncbi:hydrogenase 2 maturation peptidase [Sulfuritortus calidifontis]|uniref:Hydrogenase 2 maturation peptidase n=1 Tax=Sulfuritortus calidifontis TaxID=1914471 RepID=A0A4R3JV04_9PROT|nr:HyaD/HybD family hydrogenase maturation endopeptidase [Sulfuritortus calidifontis]TCS71715.1 hydrogenase 2 maturation peptidase [Sulfuritortus calidifontis]